MELPDGPPYFVLLLNGLAEGMLLVYEGLYRPILGHYLLSVVDLAGALSLISNN